MGGCSSLFRREQIIDQHYRQHNGLAHQVKYEYGYNRLLVEHLLAIYGNYVDIVSALVFHILQRPQ